MIDGFPSATRDTFGDGFLRVVVRCSAAVSRTRRKMLWSDDGFGTVKFMPR